MSSASTVNASKPTSVIGDGHGLPTSARTDSGSGILHSISNIERHVSAKVSTDGTENLEYPAKSHNKKSSTAKAATRRAPASALEQTSEIYYVPQKRAASEDLDGRPAKMPRTGATADDRELATEDNAQPNPIAEPKDVVQSETTTEPDDATEPDSSAEDSLTVSTPGTTGAHVLQALGARPALYPRAPFLADLRGLQDEPDMHRQITAAPAPVGGVHPDGLIDELDEVEQPVEEEKRRTSRRVAAMNDAAVAAAAAVAKAAEEAEAEEAAEAAVVDVPTTRKRVRPAKKAARKKVAAAAKKAAAAPKKAAAPKTVATAPKMVAVAPKTVSTTPKLVAAAPNKVTTAPTKAPHTYSTRSKGEPATPVAPVEQAAPIKSTATRPNNASNKATAPANDVPRAQTTAAKSRATQAPPAQTDATKSKKSAGNKKGKKANKVIPKTLGAVEQPVAGPSNYAGAAVEQVVEYGEVPVTVFSVGSVSARGDKSKARQESVEV